MKFLPVTSIITQLPSKLISQIIKLHLQTPVISNQARNLVIQSAYGEKLRFLSPLRSVFNDRSEFDLTK